MYSYTKDNLKYIDRYGDPHYMKKILFILLFMLLLIGCSTLEGVVHSKSEIYVQDISPSLLRIGEITNNEYCYLIDTTTGIVYLE